MVDVLFNVVFVAYMLLFAAVWFLRYYGGTWMLALYRVCTGQATAKWYFWPLCIVGLTVAMLPLVLLVGAMVS